VRKEAYIKKILMLEIGIFNFSPSLAHTPKACVSKKRCILSILISTFSGFLSMFYKSSKIDVIFVTYVGIIKI